MLTLIDSEFQTGGRLLSRSDFFDEPTVGALARIVLECQRLSEGAEPAPAGILAFRQQGEGVPLFFFPGWRGRDGGANHSYYLRHLAKNVGERQPFYVITGSLPPADSIEELAGRSVDAIRRVRPHGPYFLAGHCLGGVVAFETAQRLVSSGEQVVKLVLFDAVAPGYPKMAANGSKYLAELSRMSRELDLRTAWSHAHSFARLLGGRIAGKLRRRAAGSGLKSVKVSMLNSRKGIALWQYVPNTCPVSMIHFIAADQPVSRILDDPRLGWRDVAGGGIEFRSVPGDHDSMFHAANAPQLAAQLNAFLGSKVPAGVLDEPEG